MKECECDGISLGGATALQLNLNGNCYINNFMLETMLSINTTSDTASEI